MALSNETECQTERDTVKSLKHVGKKLLRYLPSVDKLLQMLDRLEQVLSSVDQAPTKPIQESLVPSMKALISDELLRHKDEDVKISVTSCITEITRITAPDAPYDDEQMKEVFKLIVAAFDKLSHVSGRCYEKALSILDNVAKIRLCLVMLDLECDDLVIEMFQHFLRILRSNHPCNAIDSMESIMTLILDESEEISSDLLRPLLDCLRKENQNISPISWTLAEKVVTNCAVKLKPYLMRAVESSSRALDEYAQIVTSICQNGSELLQCDHSNGSKKTMVQAVENKLEVPKDTEEQSCDGTKGLEPDITCFKDAQKDDRKSNIRSDNASNRDDEIIKKSDSKRKQHSDLTKNSNSRNAKSNSETGNLESVPESTSETQLNTVQRKRGRKPNSLLNAEEGYDHSWICMGTETRKPALPRKARNSSSASQHSEIPTSRKDKLQSKSKTVSEALVSQLKNENNTKSAQTRKTHDVGSDFLLDENPASRKDNMLSKREDMSEGHKASVSNPKADDNTHASASSLKTLDIRDGSHRKRGRPRKRSSSGNQDADPNSVSILKENKLNPLLEDTSLESSGGRLKKESEVRKDSEVKTQVPIRKIKFTVKRAEKTAVKPEPVVAEIEAKVSCEDKERQNPPMNIDVESREEGKSSSQTEVKKKRSLNATPPTKDLSKSSDIKKVNTGSSISGVEETPQTRLRRRRTPVSAEASETPDLGNSLVGSRIRVWWPMDKMFYEGVVDSYDPVKGKHKILYADGDVEVLNLKKQRWEPIAVDVSPDEEQGLALHKLAEASDIAEKSIQKSELESAKGEDMNSRSKALSSAGNSKSKPVKYTIKSVDTFALDRSSLADQSMNDPPKTS